jgi:hypothetical protein
MSSFILWALMALVSPAAGPGATCGAGGCDCCGCCDGGRCICPACDCPCCDSGCDRG